MLYQTHTEYKIEFYLIQSTSSEKFQLVLKFNKIKFSTSTKNLKKLSSPADGVASFEKEKEEIKFHKNK